MVRVVNALDIIIIIVIFNIIFIVVVVIMKWEAELQLLLDHQFKKRIIEATRDVKDEDKLVHLAFGLFSGKQLPAVMCLELRKQKPLSNALDGSYLLCEEHMI